MVFCTRSVQWEAQSGMYDNHQVEWKINARVNASRMENYHKFVECCRKEDCHIIAHI